MRRATFAVRGVVQGVGFRPFVYRLARQHGLVGSVCNTSAQVIIDVQGADDAVNALGELLRRAAPPLARVVSVERTDTEPDPTLRDFVIVESHTESGARTIVPPDTAVCAECVRELFDPTDRRHRHPFITCTNCGPRFTIIRDLPYDRPATTLADLPMCAVCRAEYQDPGDRRFHAQPVSCPECGPRLWWAAAGTSMPVTPPATGAGTDAACLAAGVGALNAGHIVAIKGIGGFHLACSALDDAAVRRLRDRKAREAKPLAVMVPDLDTARAIAEVSDAEAAQLTSPAAPIVLLRRRTHIAGGAPLPVAEAVAPGTSELGVMLAYTPVHHLLFADGAPQVLVMTSGNTSGEPICFEDRDALARLAPIADAVLGHDRPIAVPCDDSVLRVIDGRVHPLRRSRGYAPMPVTVAAAAPGETKAVFAVGGELKATVCLLDGDRAYLSQHLGDMESLSSQEALAAAAQHVASLYRVSAQVWACDLHPDYHSRRWAERNHGDVPLLTVQHHHAHAVSLLAECGRIGEDALVFAFDGTGYGTDGAIWGGEALLLGSDVSEFERVAHLAQVRLPGGDAAVAQPWRIALAHLAAAGVAWDADLPCVQAAGNDARLLRQIIDRGTATTECTSMGRLFDAVASLLGVCQSQAYEAQAAIELEQLAATWDGAPASARIEPDSADSGVIDPAPILAHLIQGWHDGVPTPALAWQFHDWVARAVAGCARQIRESRGVNTIGLTGGVFANALLTALTTRALSEDGFTVLTHTQVPAGDGGLALGQALVAQARVAQATPTTNPAGHSRPAADHHTKENA